MTREPTFRHKREVPTAKPPALRILGLMRSEDGRTDLAAWLGQIEEASAQLLLRTSPLLGAMLGGDNPPDMLLVETLALDADDLDYIAELKSLARSHRVPIVCLSERANEQAALRAIRAGADDIILKPVDLAEAREVFTRITGVGQATPVLEGRLGGTISFIHVSGGAGATTLAVNSAVLLATRASEGQTCLLDLDVQYGNAASLLDLTGHSPIETFIDDSHRLDREMLEGMMLKHATGLRVLTAPRLPFPLNAYSSDMVGRLLEVAKRRFSHVVVDMPMALAPWTDIVLRQSQINYLVCSPSVASVHRAVQFLNLLRLEELHHLPLKLVLNRYVGFRRGTDISSSKFSETIGRPVDHVLPDEHPLISMSHNQGHAASQIKPKAKFVRALASMLANDLHLDELADHPHARTRKRFGRR